ncbi:hypothetical protein FB45DRAFT_1059424 [Roridomyces roridus]|uniref:RING-type domain-containing protein n=1 Tax=Roridomyces roridus TaxID=1738132 RepID=A0AAD7BRG9_9AGAR|nr:hypothetical protein FB45DRAFT_1059424 [Roridomyces roridus]
MDDILPEEQLRTLYISLVVPLLFTAMTLATGVLWLVLWRPMPWYAFRRLVLLASLFSLPSIISMRPFCRVTHRLFGRCLYKMVMAVWRSLNSRDKIFLVFYLILWDTFWSLRDVMEYTAVEKSRKSSKKTTKAATSTSSAFQKQLVCSAMTKLKELEDRWENAKEHLQCSVCLGVLRQPYVTSCGHVFDVGCLLRWFLDAPPFEDMDQQLDPSHPDYFRSRSKTCPLCRTVLKTPPIPLFFLEGLLDLMGFKEVDRDSLGRMNLRPHFWRDMFARERIRRRRLNPDAGDLLLDDMLAAAREEPQVAAQPAIQPAPLEPQPQLDDGPQRQLEQERPLLLPREEPRLDVPQPQPEPVIPPVALPLQPQPGVQVPAEPELLQPQPQRNQEPRRLLLFPRGQPEVEPRLGGLQPQPEVLVRPAHRPAPAVEPQPRQEQEAVGPLPLPPDEPAAEPEPALQRAPELREPERQADRDEELEALQLVQLFLFQAEL